MSSKLGTREPGSWARKGVKQLVHVPAPAPLPSDRGASRPNTQCRGPAGSVRRPYVWLWSPPATLSCCTAGRASPGTRQHRAQALWVSQPVARMDGWGEGPRPSQSPSRPCDRPRCAPRGLAWGCRCDYSTAPLGTRRGILDRVPPRQTASPVKPQCTCPQLGHFTVHKPPGPGPVQDVSETHDPPGAPAYFSRPTAPWTALAGSSGSETGER